MEAPIEARTRIASPPSEVFAVYRDVENWSAWHPDARQVSLHGPFALGTTGDLVPANGRAVTLQIMAIESDRALTVDVHIPFFRIRFHHELAPVREGTEVLHRVGLSGPLTRWLGATVGRPLRMGLPYALQGLRQYVEQRIAIR